MELKCNTSIVHFILGNLKNLKYWSCYFEHGRVLNMRGTYKLILQSCAIFFCRNSSPMSTFKCDITAGGLLHHHLDWWQLWMQSFCPKFTSQPTRYPDVSNVYLPWMAYCNSPSGVWKFVTYTPAYMALFFCSFELVFNSGLFSWLISPIFSCNFERNLPLDSLKLLD